MLETRLTELLGIKYPIQCGTMHAVTRADLVAAVANAGGLCCICSAYFPDKESLMDEIKKTRDLTDKPFGVNIGLFPAMLDQPVEERIDWVIESGVKILETAGRSPEPYRKQIVDGGLTHIHKCARVRDAIKVDKMGVDVVSIVGTECGGHPSMEGVTSMVLIPQAIDAVNAPLIAGGGFCDGRSLIVALALGASGVNMGTRFMSTKECTIHQAVKERIVDSPETCTVVVQRSIGNPSRVYKNPWAEKVLDLEAKGATFEELVPYISGERGRKIYDTGNIEEGLLPLGQVAGRIRDIPTVDELMNRIINEAMEVKKRLDQLI